MPSLAGVTLEAPGGYCKPVNGAHAIQKDSLDLHKFGLDSSFTVSYPTKSLNFLRKLEYEQHQGSRAATSTEQTASARCKLKVLVVGAGLGGLSVAIALARTGHSVVVLEQTQTLGEVGAGIQIPPNVSRLLKRWGVLDHLEHVVVQPDCINFRRWEDGSVIGLTKLGPEFRDNFESPFYVVHRAHFHEALYRRATELGVTIRLNSRVIKYVDDSSVVLEDGGYLRGDLIVGADGIHSSARQAVELSKECKPLPTGFAAYRATVNVEKMQSDDEIAWLLEKPSLNIWIGEDRHVMTYTIASGKSFNMVLSHRDTSDPATWQKRTAVEDMRQEFQGWDPRLTKIISMIDSTLKWPLMTVAPMTTWTASSQKLVIIGDAAHAMVPYMSQGAGMAVEDGAALAVVLRRITSDQELSFALRVFEVERIKRSGDMQRASMINGLIWHFADGKEQEARDAAMRAEVDEVAFSWSANQWSDPVTQWWAYGYDAEDAMEKRWDEAVANLIRRHSMNL